jgi:predicted RNA-binding Zn-ribbon protein involved in translation (DUF1610 family)
MARTATTRQVTCYHCRAPFTAGGKAMSLPCPRCHKVVIVEDIIVRNYRPVKRLHTCGRVVVRKGGRVAAELVEAHQGIEVNGTLHAHVVSGGPVIIGATAEWKGDCRAPSVQVRAGARVRGGFFQVPDTIDAGE